MASNLAGETRSALVSRLMTGEVAAAEKSCINCFERNALKVL